MIVLLMLGVLVAQRQSGGRLAEAEGDLPSTDGGGNSADRLDDAVCVVEGGLRFELDLTRGEHIGLFFDSRPARGLVRSLAAGRRVLNLFAYSGGMCAPPPPPPPPAPPHHHHHPAPHTPSSLSKRSECEPLLQGGCSRGRGCTLHDKRRQQADVPQASGAKLRSQQIASRQPHVLLRRRGAFYEDGGARQLAALRFDHSRPASK